MIRSADAVQLNITVCQGCISLLLPRWSKLLSQCYTNWPRSFSILGSNNEIYSLNFNILNYRVLSVLHFFQLLLKTDLQYVTNISCLEEFIS